MSVAGIYLRSRSWLHNIMWFVQVDLGETSGVGYLGWDAWGEIPGVKYLWWDTWGEIPGVGQASCSRKGHSRVVSHCELFSDIQ